MDNYLIFHMWRGVREGLIERHAFFVDEARMRLLAQFTEESMKADADRHAEAWLAERAQNFNPERDDPGSNYEVAHDEGVGFYLSLEDLRSVTRLSIVAGMYHEWEKQLRDWLVRELMRIARGEHLRKAVWMATVDQIFEFLESWQWPVKTRAYYRDLRLCHLVVNVYKHGGGTSLTELRKLAPELLGQRADQPLYLTSVLDHTHLTLDDQNIDRFSEAILAFWHDLPETVCDGQITNPPKWLLTAIGKDANGRSLLTSAPG